MPADYSKLKVAELKDVLKQRGIPQTGLTKKQQMVDALEEDDAKKGEQVLSEVAGAMGDVKGGGEAEEDGKVEPAVEETEPKSGDAKAHDADMEEAVVESEQANAESQPQPPTTQADEAPVSVLATPQPTSDLPEDSGSESRKRKRRSPTPEVREASVSKKLKAAEEASGEAVVQDEPMAVDENATGEKEADAMVEDAPLPLGGAADTISAQPYGISDDVMRDVEPEQPTSDGPVPTNELPETDSLHPPTSALYIRDLIRPLQPTQLQDHLTSLIPSGSSTSLKAFHLDTLRTHAFAVFPSPNIAVAVRNALHNTIFPPDDPTRKPLWVDFAPEEKVQQWIDMELAAGTSRRDAKRWEVEYDDSYGDLQVSLREVRPGAHGPPQRQGSASQAPGQGAGMGMPNAPLGPRGTGSRANDVSAIPPSGPHASTRAEDRAPTPQHPPPDASPSTAHKPQPPTFSALDAKFSATTTKPKLYFLPQPTELAERRLAELERETSRNWRNGGVSSSRDGEGVDGQLRRYTFEDGDRVVDGGPDRGSFGAVGGPGGGGFGVRGGGGFGGGGRGRGRGGYGGRR